MKSTKNILVVENLNYDILNDINFSLEASTFTALIGKNRSGKTLLLKCISGLTPHTGKVSLKGNTIKKTSTLNKSIGLYLGVASLSNKTAFLNILEPLINLGISQDKAKNKVYEVSQKIGIDKMLHKPIQTLSFSQKKIVAFAKCVAYGPDILLLDNLFDGLDISYKNIIIKYLKGMNQEKKLTVIFTTNDSENLMLADNIIILNNGKIVANGSCQEIFRDDSIFIKNKLKTPFVIDLSNKLKSYGLLDNLIYNIPDMVEALWK